MSDQEMIEIIQIAIWERTGNKVSYESIKHIIKAMREPTDKMMVEMESAEPQLECFLAKEQSPSYIVWTAAIDSILND